MFSFILSLPVIAAVVAAPALRTDHPDAHHWKGHLSFRGDEWPIRLSLDTTRSPILEVDLPAPNMAWEPLVSSLAGDSLSFELPFGLGGYAFSLADHDVIMVRRELAGEPIVLTLRPAAEPPYTRADVRFQNGEATLAGTIVRPTTPGSHPGLVLVHGSSPQGRDSWEYRSWADYYARLGFIVLYYDKRGVGESDGPWMTTTFPDLAQLADDAAAAVRLLRTDAAVGEDAFVGGASGNRFCLKTVPMSSCLPRLR